MCPTHTSVHIGLSWHVCIPKHVLREREKERERERESEREMKSTSSKTKKMEPRGETRWRRLSVCESQKRSTYTREQKQKETLFPWWLVSRQFIFHKSLVRIDTFQLKDVHTKCRHVALNPRMQTAHVFSDSRRRVSFAKEPYKRDYILGDTLYGHLSHVVREHVRRQQHWVFIRGSEKCLKRCDSAWPRTKVWPVGHIFFYFSPPILLCNHQICLAMQRHILLWRLDSCIQCQTNTLVPLTMHDMILWACIV